MTFCRDVPIIPSLTLPPPFSLLQTAVQAIAGPLEADEIALLEQALVYYGKQPWRWEIICREHLPHRQANVSGRARL